MSSASPPLPRDRHPHALRHIGPREFIALMAMVQALQALAVDSMLPALGRLSHDLGVNDPNRRQLVVGIFLIFGGFGALLPGTAADRFGRKPVLTTVMIAYVLLSAACAVATSFDALLVFRALLGTACAGLMVLPAAIIRDCFDGDRMARMQSTVAMVFMVVPMMAPSVGQAVLLVAGWRWIFGVMGVLGLVVLVWMRMRLPETLAPGARRPAHPAVVVATIGEVLGNRSALGYVFGLAVITGALFGYINSTQQLVGEHFGAGARFPLIFAGMAMAMAATNFVNSRIVERFGARRVSHAALLVYIAASLGHVAVALSGHETLLSFVPLMTVNLCLMGFIGANFASISLQPFAGTAGAAASAQSFIRMVAGSCLGSLIGLAYDNSALPLSWAMLAAGVSALGMVLFSEHGTLFRRLLPPGAPRPVA